LLNQVHELRKTAMQRILLLTCLVLVNVSVASQEIIPERFAICYLLSSLFPTFSYIVTSK